MQDPFGHPKGGQGRLMKAAQDQFLFTRVGDHVTDRKKPRHIGAEVFGVDFDLLVMHLCTPLRNRAQLRRQA